MSSAWQVHKQENLGSFSSCHVLDVPSCCCRSAHAGYKSYALLAHRGLPLCILLPVPCCSQALRAFTWQACGRCAALDLDPLQVLQQMLPSMPLAEAVSVLAHLLRERAHRRRHGSILRNLWRSSSIAASVDKVEVRGCFLLGRMHGYIDRVAMDYHLWASVQLFVD